MSGESTPRSVAIVGLGQVGEAIARGLAATGDYDLLFGTRQAANPEESLASLAAELDARVDTPRDATREADAVLLAVPGTAVVEVASDLAPVLDGTPVLDCTNGPVPEGFRSIGEAVTAAVGDAPVAKVFNTIGANRMTTPEFDDGTASMFVCGDDAAVAVAADLAESLGFGVVTAGDISAARHLEAIAGAWIHLAGRHGRDIGFRLLGIED